VKRERRARMNAWGQSQWGFWTDDDDPIEGGAITAEELESAVAEELPKVSNLLTKIACRHPLIAVRIIDTLYQRHVVQPSKSEIKEYSYDWLLDRFQRSGLNKSEFVKRLTAPKSDDPFSPPWPGEPHAVYKQLTRMLQKRRAPKGKPGRPRRKPIEARSKPRR
jgi:hypothetical protein